MHVVGAVSCVMVVPELCASGTKWTPVSPVVAAVTKPHTSWRRTQPIPFGGHGRPAAINHCLCGSKGSFSSATFLQPPACRLTTFLLDVGLAVYRMLRRSSSYST